MRRPRAQSRTATWRAEPHGGRRADAYDCQPARPPRRHSAAMRYATPKAGWNRKASAAWPATPWRTASSGIWPGTSRANMERRPTRSTTWRKIPAAARVSGGRCRCRPDPVRRGDADDPQWLVWRPAVNQGSYAGPAGSVVYHARNEGDPFMERRSSGMLARSFRSPALAYRRMALRRRYAAAGQGPSTPRPPPTPLKALGAPRWAGARTSSSPARHRRERRRGARSDARPRCRASSACCCWSRRTRTCCRRCSTSPIRSSLFNTREDGPVVQRRSRSR